jgi:hypothetical protein
MEADKAFQTALENAYGPNAGDMRYRRDLPPAIASLGKRYQIASEAMMGFWRLQREGYS